MQTPLFRILSFVLVGTLLFSSGTQWAAGNTQPPQSIPDFHALEAWGSPGPMPDPVGAGGMPGEKWIISQPLSAVALLASGGPDTYGYTWVDTEPLAWIDVSAGAALTASAVDIGFNFKFYENTYSQIYVSQYGYASFEPKVNTKPPYSMPDSNPPNNVVAPHWAYSDLINGYIRTLSIGTAPDRLFVAEWNHVASTGRSDDFTFELVLHEDGDIVFQYQVMNYGLSSYGIGISGIEDSQGTDGLTVTSWSKVASNHAVRVSRPDPIARVSLNPVIQGSFTRPAGVVSFILTARNLGELGTDTYDLVSDPPISLYAADGTTPLADTNGDGVVDTGPVAQGAVTGLIARIQTPANAVVGDAQTGTVTATSSWDPSKSKTVTLQTAVPAAFAQVYKDSTDGAMSLYLAQPQGSYAKKTAAPGTDGATSSIFELPNGNFIYAWTKGRCLSTCSLTTTEIQYMLVNKYGETVRPVSQLTDNTGASTSTLDQEYMLAAAPDGHIGVIWLRLLGGGYNANFNLFFAILDSAGNISYGPVNLTNINGLYPDAPRVGVPRIAATADNRFTLAWERSQKVLGCSSGDCFISDIYYAVRSISGGVIIDPVQHTHDTSGGSQISSNYWPNLTVLSGNRTLLTWDRAYPYHNTIYFSVLDSAGTPLASEMDIFGTEGGPASNGADAIQLSDGKIVVAWRAQMGGVSYILFAVIGDEYGFPRSHLTTLNNPYSITSSDSVSVTADLAGNAILTWTCWTSNLRKLCYALVDGSGAVKTQPMIFRSSQEPAQSILTSTSGDGNTTYRSFPIWANLTFLPLIRR